MDDTNMNSNRNKIIIEIGIKLQSKIRSVISIINNISYDISKRQKLKKLKRYEFRIYNSMRM